jgi:hypothetical protein
MGRMARYLEGLNTTQTETVSNPRTKNSHRPCIGDCVPPSQKRTPHCPLPILIANSCDRHFFTCTEEVCAGEVAAMAGRRVALWRATGNAGVPAGSIEKGQSSSRVMVTGSNSLAAICNNW